MLFLDVASSALSAAIRASSEARWLPINRECHVGQIERPQWIGRGQFRSAASHGIRTARYRTISLYA